MIGSGLVVALSQLGFEITEFNRSGYPVVEDNAFRQFDVLSDTWEAKLTTEKNFDFVINSLGLIRHKIEGRSQKSIEEAIYTNSIFPLKLDQLSSRNNFTVIQIGTDCVFSGSTGTYAEDSNFDPLDVYGFTKALGESSLENTFTLRTSVTGLERKSTIELMNWVLSQPINSKIDGFENHGWNGVTPLQLAKVLSFAISTEQVLPGVQHLVPGDKVSKFQLVKMIVDYGGRKDITVEPFKTSNSIDRSLSTLYPQRNIDLWSGAGYPEPPLIRDMIAEYASWADIRQEK